MRRNSSHRADRGVRTGSQPCRLSCRSPRTVRRWQRSASQGRVAASTSRPRSQPQLSRPPT
ncbi:MAG: hypothetical protein EON61_26030 [Alphaproteobacteria bacterium]|nr:MAG: hypothetical protein EON61_26030 [Alphaproteobacteria bacterium]